PGAVPGVGLGTCGAPVVEVAKGGQRLDHDVVARHTGEDRDEGDSAGVLLVSGVIETLARRECVHGILPSSSEHPMRASACFGWAVPLGTTLAQAGKTYHPGMNDPEMF